MGLEQRSTQNNIANDNGLTDMQGHDDRMGFNYFVRTAATEHQHHRSTPTQPSSYASDTIEEPHRRKRSGALPPRSTWSKLWPLLLLMIIMTTAFLSLKTLNPASRLLGCAALIVMTVTAAGLASWRRAFRVKSISLLAALAACLGLITTLSQSFGLNVFSSFESSFWILTAVIAGFTAWALKSRTALIISIALTAFWAYAVYTAQVSFDSKLLALPLIAALQIFAAHTLDDGFSRRLSQFILYGWSLTALIFAAMSGLTTAPFIVSALTLMTGLFYLSATHPFHIWAHKKSRGIALVSWFAFMSCSLATFWLWLVPSAIDTTERSLSPMLGFMWQIGLITGVLALAATALFRQHSTSHSLARRLMSAVIILILSASHYFQSAGHIGPISDNLGTVYMIAAVCLLGGLGVVILNKFVSAIRYSHAGAVILGFILVLAFLASVIFVGDVNIELLYLAAFAALVTIFGLSVTHKRKAKFSNGAPVYRPLKTPAPRDRIHPAHRRQRQTSWMPRRAYPDAL